MVNLAKVSYKVVAVDKEGAQLDITELVTGLGWSEDEKGLSAKINFKLAITGNVNDLIQPAVQILIYADMGEGFTEVMRGNVQKYILHESNGEFSLSVECADEAHALRQSQDDFYFSPDHSGESIIKKILEDNGVPYKIEIEDEKLGKKVYRAKYLSDCVQDVLKDLKERGKGFFFVRAKEGVIEIIPRGTNDTIFHFDISENAVSVKESLDASKVVTRVKVVGKEKTEGHQSVEATINGDLNLGTRQIIYRRGDKESSGEAETAAKKILDENGIKRETSLEAPDIPSLRKGDRIRLKTSLGEGFFFIKSIRHDAPRQKMTLQLDYDGEFSKAQGLADYDLAKTNEQGDESPP